jgi:hypothetical protein
VVNESLVGGKDEESELSGWEDSVGELLESSLSDGESWGDDSALVDSSVQVNNNLSTTSIIDDLEVVDVASLLHLNQELNDDLGDWSKDNLKNINYKKQELSGQSQHGFNIPSRRKGQNAQNEKKGQPNQRPKNESLTFIQQTLPFFEHCLRFSLIIIWEFWTFSTVMEPGHNTLRRSLSAGSRRRGLKPCVYPVRNPY